MHSLLHTCLGVEVVSSFLQAVQAFLPSHLSLHLQPAPQLAIAVLNESVNITANKKMDSFFIIKYCVGDLKLVYLYKYMNF
jgi:hypothetical protein